MDRECPSPSYRSASLDLVPTQFTPFHILTTFCQISILRWLQKENGYLHQWLISLSIDNVSTNWSIFLELCSKVKQYSVTPSSNDSSVEGVRNALVEQYQYPDNFTIVLRICGCA